MLINLLPDFFAVLDSTDRLAAYQRYFDSHRKILEPYWHNYVIDPDGPHYRGHRAIDRRTRRVRICRAMLERTDVVSLARNTEQQCRELLAMDCDVDVVLMVGVGAANAGELVVDGRGIAFVCLEHFTGADERANARASASTRSSFRSGWRTKSRTSCATRRRRAAASCATCVADVRRLLLVLGHGTPRAAP